MDAHSENNTMSANAGDVAGVGTATTAQEIGEVLSGMQVDVRAEPFPRAANGGARACSDARAAHVRSEMQREGGSAHWEGIFALALCDLADGAQPERVRAVFVRALAEIDAHIPKARIDRPIAALLQLETKAQSGLDLAQYQLAANETSPEANQAVLTAAQRYAAFFTELQARCLQTLTVHRSRPREVFGARRSRIRLHS